MEYKKSDSDRSPHELIFRAEEVKVMRAAYNEMLVKRELEGESGADSRSARSVALFPRRHKAMVWRVPDLRPIADNLKLFADSTDAEVEMILELPIPRFKNREAIIRRKYGEVALRLSFELQDLAVLQKPISESEVELFAVRIQSIEDDDIRELWEPSSE